MMEYQTSQVILAKTTCNQVQGYFVYKCVTHSQTISGL